MNVKMGVLIVCVVAMTSTLNARAQGTGQFKDGLLNETPPSSKAPEMVYSTLESALSFFQRLQLHLEADFRNPAMRKDATIKLRAIAVKIDELIASNDELIKAIRAQSDDQTDAALDRVSVLLKQVQSGLREVERLVPDADRVTITPRINQAEIGGASKNLIVDDIYHRKSLPPAEVEKKARTASALSYTLSNEVAELISALDGLNARH